MQRLRSLVVATFGSPALAALLYSLLAFPLAIAVGWLTLAGLVFGCLLSVTPLGVWLLAGTVRAALGLGALQRALVRRLLGLEIEPPLSNAASGVLAWRRTVWGNRTGWKAVGCALLAPVTAALAYVAAAIGYVYGALFTLHPLIEHGNYHAVHHLESSVTRGSLQVLGFQVDSWPRWLIPVTAGLLLLAAAPHLVRHALAPHRRRGFALGKGETVV